MHKGYERMVSNATVAVLFLHGIVGTPNHFREFVRLVPGNVSVCNLLLDGHGGSVKEFAKTSMQRWNQQVDEKVRTLLQTHESLMIAAHSMGTLFAIRQAVTHPERIKGLFLLASPLKIRMRWQSVQNSLRTCFGIERNDPITLAAIEAYGIETDWRVWRYLGWIPRYLELLSESRKTRALVSQISVPCHVFQSGKDEVVSAKSCDLFAVNSNINCTVLEYSSHYYYHPQDRKYLQQNFKEMLT